MIELYLEREGREKMKKKICVFELDDEYSSNDVRNDIRLIADVMYEWIVDLDCRSSKQIVIHSNGIYDNVLHKMTQRNEYRYVFESERVMNDYELYEPLFINDRMFGITVYDESIEISEMMKLLNRVVMSLGMNYRFSSREVVYDSRNDNDESNRKNALKGIDKKKRTYGLVKKLIPMVPKKLVRGY